MKSKELDKDKAVKLLNRIMELELAGVVRYTHYSLMVYGAHRIPIVDWLRQQATESLTHAQQAGELVTHLGGHPSLKLGPLLETHNHGVEDILRESLEHEHNALEAYRKLNELVEGKSVMLEEFARQMLHAEELHLGEVDKMLREPGVLTTFRGS
jgi:bacterioferritin